MIQRNATINPQKYDGCHKFGFDIFFFFFFLIMACWKRQRQSYRIPFALSSNCCHAGLLRSGWITDIMKWGRSGGGRSGCMFIHALTRCSLMKQAFPQGFPLDALSELHRASSAVIYRSLSPSQHNNKAFVYLRTRR